MNIAELYNELSKEKEEMTALEGAFYMVATQVDTLKRKIIGKGNELKRSIERVESILNNVPFDNLNSCGELQNTALSYEMAVAEYERSRYFAHQLLLAVEKERKKKN